MVGEGGSDSGGSVTVMSAQPLGRIQEQFLQLSRLSRVFSGERARLRDLHGAHVETWSDVKTQPLIFPALCIL